MGQSPHACVSGFACGCLPWEWCECDEDAGPCDDDPTACRAVSAAGECDAAKTSVWWSEPSVATDTPRPHAGNASTSILREGEKVRRGVETGGAEDGEGYVARDMDDDRKRDEEERERRRDGDDDVTGVALSNDGERHGQRQGAEEVDWLQIQPSRAALDVNSLLMRHD
ncbi:hypothetical protein B0H10DRAFT_1952958 [Mycena sp. CBHHK59/15]|nr:hypothetical protein B0H10DRAFT_1952958 [Mycena sp. CBHHK59/15]